MFVVTGHPRPAGLGLSLGFCVWFLHIYLNNGRCIYLRLLDFSFLFVCIFRRLF